MVLELLDDLLTLEQQALLARLLSDRMAAGFGDVVLRVQDGRVRWMGQAFLEDASPHPHPSPPPQGGGDSAEMPAVHLLPKRRRRS